MREGAWYRRDTDVCETKEGAGDVDNRKIMLLVDGCPITHTHTQKGFFCLEKEEPCAKGCYQTEKIPACFVVEGAATEFMLSNLESL